ncbi:MAG TPA: tetratricopeptide repeat protein [Thermoanaerobaculia bacterium]|nr:tetratricopeptide repeat protein [Thermoanaerobaculia bacterium]
MSSFAPAAACLLLLVACGDGGRPAELEPLPAAPTAGVEPGVREQLAGERERLAAQLEQRADAAELAWSWGRMGRLFHAYGLLPQAAACYRNAARLEAEERRWPYLLGAVYQQQGELEPALEALSRALDLAPGDPPSLLRLGEVALSLDRLEVAGEHFAAAGAAPAYRAAAEWGLARVAMARGDAGEAADRFRATLAAQPEASSVHYALGLALREQGELEAARRQMQRQGSGEVRFADPWIDEVDRLAVSAAAHLRRGGRALVNGQVEEAVEAYRQAVAADPEHVEARRNLALALLRRGDAQGALAELGEARRRDPENLWVLFDLGNALQAAGRPGEAAASWQRALARAPAFVPARFNLANQLAAAGRWEEASTHLERAVRDDPHHLRARYQLAMAHLQLGRSPEAERRLRELLAEAPAFVPARQGLAAVLAARGELDAARRELEAGLQSAGEEGAAAPLHLELGRMEERQGRPEAALERYAAALAADPRRREALHGEARSLIALGRWAEARRRAETGLAGAGGDAELAALLVRVLAAAPDPAVRDGGRAVTLAQRLLAARRSAEHAELLAMALAESGDFDQAAALQQQLVAQARAAGRRAEAERLEAALARYRRGEPWRLPSP